MNKDLKRRHLGHPFDIPPRFQWIRWPIITLGGGGTAVALWLQEEVVTLAECVPFAVMSALAGIIYWFNHWVYRATTSCPKDKSSQVDYNASTQRK